MPNTSNTAGLELLLDALTSYLEAKRTLDTEMTRAMEAGNQDFDYHGAEFYRRRDQAADAFSNQLEAVIDARIRMIAVEKLVVDRD